MIEAEHDNTDIKLKETFDHLHQGKENQIKDYHKSIRMFQLCSPLHDSKYRLVDDRKDSTGQGETCTGTVRDGRQKMAGWLL